MVFSDTTNKNGVIQSIEFWTGLGDGAISGDATLLSIMTSRVNQAFDRIYPNLFAYLKTAGFDDTNNIGDPVKLIDIVSGTGAYTALTDDNSLDILVITSLGILGSATATDYSYITKVPADDKDAPKFISPQASSTGSPSRAMIIGNKIYFDIVPDYSVTSGIKIEFNREFSRFVSTDTTKEPGIPKPFHELLSVYASHDWIVVNKPSNTTLITRLEAEIGRRERDLDNFIASRVQVKPHFEIEQENNR